MSDVLRSILDRYTLADGTLDIEAADAARGTDRAVLDAFRAAYQGPDGTGAAAVGNAAGNAAGGGAKSSPTRPPG